MAPVIAHVVVMKPLPALSPADRQAFIDAFRRALTEIPTVRGVRLGRRILFGANYESLSPDAGQYLAMIDFDDLAGLQTYLTHPAHQELGARFYQTLESAMVFDYRMGGIELLDDA